jgi:hypothetical protein
VCNIQLALLQNTPEQQQPQMKTNPYARQQMFYMMLASLTAEQRATIFNMPPDKQNRFLAVWQSKRSQVQGRPQSQMERNPYGPEPLFDMLDSLTPDQRATVLNMPFDTQYEVLTRWQSKRNQVQGRS